MTQEPVVSPIPKVELPIEYALGWRTSDYSSNFAVNNPVYWENFETNTKSIQKGTGNTYQLTLRAGKVYKLTGYVALREQSNALFGRRFRWFNVTKNTYIGSEGGIYSGYSSYTAGGSAPAIAYAKLDEDSVFELRCTSSSPSGDVDYITHGTSFEIEHLQNLKI